MSMCVCVCVGVETCSSDDRIDNIGDGGGDLLAADTNKDLRQKHAEAKVVEDKVWIPGSGRPQPQPQSQPQHDHTHHTHNTTLHLT